MDDVAACGTAGEQSLRGKEYKRRRPLNSGKRQADAGNFLSYGACPFALPGETKSKLL
jgi:hypothetical protein